MDDLFLLGMINMIYPAVNAVKFLNQTVVFVRIISDNTPVWWSGIILSGWNISFIASSLMVPTQAHRKMKGI